jgi:hypothetical protein
MIFLHMKRKNFKKKKKEKEKVIKWSKGKN